MTAYYTHEEGAWVADVPKRPNIFAGGLTLREAQKRVREAVGPEPSILHVA